VHLLEEGAEESLADPFLRGFEEVFVARIQGGLD